MAYSVIDLNKLVDPSIECGDRLAVNMQKGKSLLLIVSLLCLSLTGAFLLMQNRRLDGIVLMLGTVPLLGYACYIVIVMHNPMLAIDKSGIAIKNKFYSWDSVGSIFFEKDGNRKKPKRIRLLLKNGGLVTFFIPLFLDQRPPVIATYVAKFFKPVQAKV
jgi:hypothetical protein